MILAAGFNCDPGNQEVVGTGLAIIIRCQNHCQILSTDGLFDAYHWLLLTGSPHYDILLLPAKVSAE
jgi:hypothetical protein